MIVFHRLPVLLAVCCFSNYVSSSRVSITNNGYRDLVVVISPDVQSDQAADVLWKIQVQSFTF
jgi:hypothetical protein